MLGGPQYTVLRVEDVERSTAFYVEHFGWEPSGIQPDGGQIFHTEPGVFMLFPKETGKTDTMPRVGYGAQFGVDCPDLDACFKRFKESGVEFYEEIVDRGFYRMFAVYDPDGYVVFLVENN